MRLPAFIERARISRSLQSTEAQSRHSIELVDLVREQVQLDQVISWIRDIMVEEQGQADQLASLMELHPLGFEKYVIWDDPTGARARLHYWPKNKWPIESIHDHRFSFCAKVLCGNYVHEQYELLNLDASSGLVELEKTETTIVRAGDTYFFPAGSFHRVIPGEETTLSFLVRGPALLPYSRVVDPETRVMRKAYGAASKLRTKLNELIKDLSEQA